MRHFKTLIILALLATSSFAALSLKAVGNTSNAAEFAGNDRPIHFWSNATGYAIGQNDSVFFVSSNTKAPLKTSDFNKNFIATNATPGSNAYPGWVDFRKDSVYCNVSLQRIDADTSDVAWSAFVLDHGTTYMTAGSGNFGTNVALTRYRVAFPATFSTQYYLQMTLTTATDSVRVFRTVCGDK